MLVDTPAPVLALSLSQQDNNNVLTHPDKDNDKNTTNGVWLNKTFELKLWTAHKICILDIVVTPVFILYCLM